MEGGETKMTKDLTEKAIDFKGKKYVLVSDRIIYFNETYPNGTMETVLLSDPKDDMVVVKAKVCPDVSRPERVFTGHSQAKWGEGYINKTSALENAETSAIGRALALMGIGVIDSVASIDEINKATAQNHVVEDQEPDSAQPELCETHEIEMVRKLSAKTGKMYWSHVNDLGEICFGKGYQKKTVFTRS